MIVMGRKILMCMLVIGVVSMLLGAGTFSYFSDVETSAGNTFTAGTWYLKTSSLNPDYGYDTTDSPYTLTASDLEKLASSNEVGYKSKDKWDTTYSDDEYIEFDFPDIPAEATVTKVVLKFEWRGGTAISAARLQIWDGSSWQIYEMPTPLPDPEEKRTEAINLKGLYGINTAVKVNALKIWFQAHDGTGALFTWHDWVQVDVEWQ
jgi:predicted ribosomally synthesized peptide with SipW-like signal peptide